MGHSKINAICRLLWPYSAPWTSHCLSRWTEDPQLIRHPHLEHSCPPLKPGGFFSDGSHIIPCRIRAVRWFYVCYPTYHATMASFRSWPLLWNFSEPPTCNRRIGCRMPCDNGREKLPILAQPLRRVKRFEGSAKRRVKRFAIWTSECQPFLHD